MDNNEKKSFYEKYKTDKKYKAKMQLIGYGLFILLLVLYINISNATSTTHGNIISLRSNIEKNVENSNTTEEKKSNLLNNMDDNYEFDIKAKITTKKEENEETKEVSYTGKRSKNNTEIIKNTNTFYKVESRYYIKNNEEYQVIKQEELYDVIEKEYIEWESIKEYIEKSSLDHVTDYSSGKKEYVYHLKVKDIIKSHQEADEVEINITEENEILTITFEYTNLIKAIQKDVTECKMIAIYKNIGKVEEFKVIEETNETTNQGETNE